MVSQSQQQMIQRQSVPDNESNMIVAPTTSAEVVHTGMGQGVTINGDVNIFNFDQNFIQILNEQGVDLQTLFKNWGDR